MAEQETIVYFRYPGDTTWQQVKVAGSSATAETESVSIPAPCAQSYELTYVVNWRNIVGAGCLNRPREYKVTRTGPFIAPIDRFVGNQWLVQLDRYDTEGNFIQSDTLNGACFGASSHAPDSELISCIPLGTPSNDCGPTECKFIVRNAEGAIVYSEQNEVCPEWKISSGCPPDTIECGDCCLDCGDYLGDVRSLISQVKQLTGSPVAYQG
ncbi:MAG: hypothetical protein ACTS2F_29270 [Thainema sp.]